MISSLGLTAGLSLFEGDIKLTAEQITDKATIEANLWLGGVVVFEFSEQFSK